MLNCRQSGAWLPSQPRSPLLQFYPLPPPPTPPAEPAQALNSDRIFSGRDVRGWLRAKTWAFSTTSHPCSPWYNPRPYFLSTIYRQTLYALGLVKCSNHNVWYSFPPFAVLSRGNKRPRPPCLPSATLHALYRCTRQHLLLLTLRDGCQRARHQPLFVARAVRFGACDEIHSAGAPRPAQWSPTQPNAELVVVLRRALPRRQPLLRRARARDDWNGLGEIPRIIDACYCVSRVVRRRERISG